MADFKKVHLMISSVIMLALVLAGCATPTPAPTAAPQVPAAPAATQAPSAGVVKSCFCRSTHWTWVC